MTKPDVPHRPDVDISDAPRDDSVVPGNALPPRDSDRKNSINTAAMKPRYLLLAQRRSILLGNTLSRVVAATTNRSAAITTYPCIFMAAQRRFNPAIHRRRDVTPAFLGCNHNNILTRRKGGVLGPANGVRPSNAANPSIARCRMMSAQRR